MVWARPAIERWFFLTGRAGLANEKWFFQRAGSGPKKSARADLYCKYHDCVFMYVWELPIFVELSPSLFKKDKILGLISILVHHRHSCDRCASSVGNCKVKCTKKNGHFFFFRNGNRWKTERGKIGENGS